MLEYIELGKDIYIVKETRTRVNILNSILIEEEDAILIDANYPFETIDELYKRLNNHARALIISHCHTDHMAHAFYHQELYDTALLCPEQEKSHILSLDSLMQDVGFIDMGLVETFKMMAYQYMKFREAKNVDTFNPGETLHYFSVEIETIHIPGHSPGHTAFIIRSVLNDHNRKILFVSDIGSHPYYGDLYCNLNDYYTSLDKLEKIYFSSDFILVPAHGTIYLEKDEEFFQRIRQRIQRNKERVLQTLSKSEPKSIREMVFQGILTPTNKMNPSIKDLYLLWDGGMVLQHIKELIEQGLAEKVEEKNILDDKYILVN